MKSIPHKNAFQNRQSRQKIRVVEAVVSTVLYLTASKPSDKPSDARRAARALERSVPRKRARCQSEIRGRLIHSTALDRLRRLYTGYANASTPRSQVFRVQLSPILIII
jgi:hypothetical protein